MGFYNFPNTRNYDSDLGFLIKSFEELTKSYKDLVDVYQNIEKEISNVVIKLFTNGDIKLDAIYDSENESISFTFINNLQEKRYINESRCK